MFCFYVILFFLIFCYQQFYEENEMGDAPAWFYVTVIKYSDKIPLRKGRVYLAYTSK